MNVDRPGPEPAMRPTPLGFKIALGLLATLLGLGVSEVGARLMYPVPPDPTRQPPIGYRYDAEIRYVFAPNQAGWIDDGFVHINSLGFRGAETVVPKPAGRFRIVSIGDSLTMGWGVGDAETFSARLETQLRHAFPDRDLDVVNLGVGGYNTRQEVTLLERNIDRLEPDLVLVGFYSNDIPEGLGDTGAAAGGTRIAAVNPEGGRMMYINPTPSSWGEAALRHSRLAFTAGRAVKRLMHRGEQGTSGFLLEMDVLQGKDSPELERAWAGIEKQFEVLRDAARGRFAVGILVLPCLEQVMGQYTTARYQSRLRDIADRLGFFVVDPLPALTAASGGADSLFIAYDRNHPSVAGHRVIADSLFQSLAKDPTMLTSKTVHPPAAGS